MNIFESLKIIKKIVSNPDKADALDPIMVATTYAGQCEMVNARLNKCVTMINKNMVNQALEEASADPHLIDLFNEMNSTATNEFRKLCKDKGWPIPEELNISAFNELMKSFSIESTIEPLLKQLRRASNQGHIGQCVAVLRELVKKDFNNPQWKTDLAEFEATYLEQIRKDLEEFKQEKNINGVARLIVEIKQPWSISTESIPVKELEEFIENQYNENLHKEEQDIVSKIGIAFQSGNVGNLGESISAYENLEKNRYFKPDPSLRIIYSNALHWYQQQLKVIELQKSFEKKLGEISNKIERGSYEGIKSLWEELKLYRLPIPEDLEPNVLKLIRKEDKAIKRQQRKKQMGYILIILFAMVCISLAATWNYYRQIRNRLVSELDNAAIAENLEECKNIIDDMAERRITFINAPLFTSSEMEKYNDKAKNVGLLLEQKRATFSLLVAELEQLKSNGFPETVAAIERKMGELIAASNAVSPNFIARMKLLQSAWEDRKKAIKAMEEKELSSIFDKINAMFNNLVPASNEEEIFINEQTLDEIENYIKKGGELTTVSDAMKQGLEELKAKSNTTKETLIARKSQLKDIKNADSLEEYMKEIQTFAGTFPDDIVTKRLNSIIAMENFYDDLLSAPPQSSEEDEKNNHSDDANSSKSSPKTNSNSDLSESNSDGSQKNDTQKSATNNQPNPFWSANAEIVRAFNNNIKIHQDEVKEELKKLERTLRFVDLWECTVSRPNFEPEKWYFNGKPSEEFVNGIKSYAGIAYVLSPNDLQPEFKANNAITVQVENLRKMDHCDFVQQMINNILYDIGMETIVHEIKNIYQRPFSPILKLHLINFLTDQLFLLVGKENAIPFAELSRDLKLFTKRPQNEQVNWLCSAHNKYTFESRQAEMVLKHYLEKPDRINNHVIQWKVRKIALKRIPKWIGFADLKDPEKLHIKTGTMPNEIWVARKINGKNRENSSDSTNSEKPIIFVTQNQKMGETVKYLEHNGYLPGEPIFAPYDNTTTNDVLQSILSNVNANLNRQISIDWPEIWPVNIRR